MKHTINLKGQTYSEQSTQETALKIRGKYTKIRANHPIAKWKRNKASRWELDIRWKELDPKITLPCHITLTRLSHKEDPMDFDNLVYSFKGIRDAVAEKILPGLPPGRADGDKRLEWKYSQEKGLYGIRIEIEDQQEDTL
jgi:hypothetical protein